MKFPEHESPIAGCDLQRVQNFLNADHYHLDDADFIAHLDACPACREFLEAQAGDPLQWKHAKDFGRRTSSTERVMLTTRQRPAGGRTPVIQLQ